jgi:hypothetical protein
MRFSELKDHLKAAEAERKAKWTAYREARGAFDSEGAKLRSMIEKRDSLFELVQHARDEAETQRAHVRAETARYLDGDGAPKGIGAASRAQKEAEAQADDLATALDEANAPITAQRRRALEAGKRLQEAHRQASVMVATCEALSAAIETFPTLRRAQRIVLACDAHSEAARLVRGLDLLPDAWECAEKDDKLTDGLGSRYVLMNEVNAIEHAGSAD